MEETLEKRGPGRPPNARPVMHSEEPRRDAAARAKEILEHLGTLGEGGDKFYIDPTVIPDGWTYEWKRLTLYNQADPSYQVELRQTGWEPVPASRHRSLMPDDVRDGPIVREGLQLMERPKEVTAAVVNMDKVRAQTQMRDKKDQAERQSYGGFDTSVNGRPVAKGISSRVGPMGIPD